VARPEPETIVEPVPPTEALEPEPAAGPETDAVMPAVPSAEPRLSERETGIRISAIVWSPKREKRFAIVNLKTVYAGDSVAESRVVEIREEEVVFERDGERFSVGMRKH